MVGVRRAILRSVGRSVWSAWRCESRTASTPPGRSSPFRAAIRIRWPIRSRNTGSVSSRVPSSSRRTVACPSHVIDRPAAGRRSDTCGSSGISCPGSKRATPTPSSSDRDEEFSPAPTHSQTRSPMDTDHSKDISQDPSSPAGASAGTYDKTVQWKPQAPRFGLTHLLLSWVVAAGAVFVAACARFVLLGGRNRVGGGGAAAPPGCPPPRKPGRPLSVRARGRCASPSGT